MVVFTCSHCGDSLQKPKVEKHYMGPCRGPKSLTCVDCLKDFREDYATHTKCVSEAERYAPKGAQPPGVKKGEVKQESWVELVGQVVATASQTTAEEKRVLDVVAASGNVPRKWHKFANFVRSAMNGRVKEDPIKSVWAMIEAAKVKRAADDKKSVDGEVADKSADAKVAKKRKSKGDESDVEVAGAKAGKKRKSKAGDLPETDANLLECSGDKSETNSSKGRKSKGQEKTDAELVECSGDKSETNSSKRRKSEKTDADLVECSADKSETNSSKRRKSKEPEKTDAELVECSTDKSETNPSKRRKSKGLEKTDADLVECLADKSETNPSKRRKSKGSEKTDSDLVECSVDKSETNSSKRRKSEKSGADANLLECSADKSETNATKRRKSKGPEKADADLADCPGDKSETNSGKKRKSDVDANVLECSADKSEMNSSKRRKSKGPEKSDADANLVEYSVDKLETNSSKKRKSKRDTNVPETGTNVLERSTDESSATNVGKKRKSKKLNGDETSATSATNGLETTQSNGLETNDGQLNQAETAGVETSPQNDFALESVILEVVKRNGGTISLAKLEKRVTKTCEIVGEKAARRFNRKLGRMSNVIQVKDGAVSLLVD